MRKKNLISVTLRFHSGILLRYFRGHFTSTRANNQEKKIISTLRKKVCKHQVFFLRRFSINELQRQS